MTSDAAEPEQPPHSFFTRGDLIALLVIASVAAVLTLPLFLRGFPEGYDIKHHYRWAYYFCEELREGAVYPRWLAGANRGYGSPALFYYPPFVFYVTAAFNVVVKNLLLSIKLSCALSMMASGVSMYVFGRPVISRTAGVIAAVLYMSAPYHVFQLWRVNALSEYWSFVWIPLILDAIRRIAVGRGWRASVYLALSYGLLLLTNLPAAMIVTSILPIWVLLLTRDKYKLVQAASGMALGVGVSAVFLVSVLFETKHVHIDRILENKYYDAFLFEDFSAFSWANLLSRADYRRIAGYPREANLAAVGIVVLLVLASVVLIVERRLVARDPTRTLVVRAMGLVAIVSLLMTTRITAPLWNSIRSLQYLQSPIRWLIPATFAIVVLTAIACQVARGSNKFVVYAALLILAVAANIGVGAHIATQRPVAPEQLEAELLNKDVVEYTPLWWDEIFHEEFEQSPVIIATGDADVRVIDGEGSIQSYQMSARTEATIKMRSVFFPGWVGRVDGQKTDLGRSAEGNIQIIVAPGSHTVSLRFEETWRHVKADIVSGASLLILAAMVYSTRRSKRTQLQ